MADKLYVREWRERRDLSIHKLASQAGLATSTVVGIESGEREPNWRTLRKLGEAFNVSPRSLFYPPDTSGADAENILSQLFALTDAMPQEGVYAAARVAEHDAAGGLDEETKGELPLVITVLRDFLSELETNLNLPDFWDWSHREIPQTPIPRAERMAAA